MSHNRNTQKLIQVLFLSVCDAAKGEGDRHHIHGLRQAFFRAGAHCIIASLWKTDVNAVQVIAEYFYHFLFLGYRKSQVFHHYPNLVPSKYF
jgi:CHAT domain-containing protein